MLEHSIIDMDRTTLGDVAELLWVPALLAISVAAATWLVWYYTHTVCTLEIAGLTGCNPARVTRYLDIDVFGRMLTYGALMGGIGGFWRYDMIRKERAARIAAQNQAAELRQQLQEERAKNAAIREEQHRQLLSALAEERQLAAEERQHAAEERQAFLAALTEFTAEIAHLRQQRNGDPHNGQ